MTRYTSITSFAIVVKILTTIYFFSTIRYGVLEILQIPLIPYNTRAIASIIHQPTVFIALTITLFNLPVECNIYLFLAIYSSNASLAKASAASFCGTSICPGHHENFISNPFSLYSFIFLLKRRVKGLRLLLRFS